LVMNNFKTHDPSAFYEIFLPEEAKRLRDRFEFIYTPKHGSWLNMAEIELHVLNGQYKHQFLKLITMKKILYLLVFSLISISSMGKVVDFSGTWNLNKSKSTLNDQFSMAPKQMIIIQASDVLDVERHSTFQDQEFTIKDKLTLDGKECINDGWQDTKKKSVAVWSDDEKSLTVTSKIPMQDGGEFTVVETYQMEENSLKVLVNAKSSMGELAETYLFDKQ
jgi:hypothetical protein